MPAIIFITTLDITFVRHLLQLLFDSSRDDACLFTQIFDSDVRSLLHGMEKQCARIASEHDAITIVPPHIGRSFRSKVNVVFKFFLYQRFEVSDKTLSLCQRSVCSCRRNGANYYVHARHQCIHFSACFSPQPWASRGATKCSSPAIGQCDRCRLQMGVCGYSGNGTARQVPPESSCLPIPLR